VDSLLKPIGRCKGVAWGATTLHLGHQWGILRRLFVVFKNALALGSRVLGEDERSFLVFGCR